MAHSEVDRGFVRARFEVPRIGRWLAVELGCPEHGPAAARRFATDERAPVQDHCLGQRD